MKIKYQPPIWTVLQTDPLQPIALNLCISHDGILRPKKNHLANCKWRYDGQVFVHV